MKYCSCLLRSCTATLVNQWDSSRERLADSQPKLLAATCRVIEFMRKVTDRLLRFSVIQLANVQQLRSVVLL